MHCNIFSEDFSVYRLYMLRVTIALNQNKDYMTENVCVFSSQKSTPLKSCISLTRWRRHRRTRKLDHFVVRSLKIEDVVVSPSLMIFMPDI